MSEWLKGEEDREKITALIVVLGLIGFLWLKGKSGVKPTITSGEGILTIYGVM